MVKKLSFGFIFLSLSIFSIFAEQDVGIKISANKYNVIVDEVFKISIAVSGASNDIKIMDIKKTDPAIVIQYSGTMSNISIINNSPDGFCFIPLPRHGCHSITPMTALVWVFFL